MRRYRPTPLLLVCVLALATGLALLRAASLVAFPAPAPATAPSAAPPGVAEANTALVRRFYAAVDAVLRTGDPAPFADLVAADFADHSAPPGLGPTRDGLVRHLLALRATFPRLSLAVEDVQEHGDFVLARVRVATTAPGAFLGFTLTGLPANWEGFDLLRVAGSRIAERWAGGDWPAPPQPLAQAPLAEPPVSTFLRLVRLTFAPGASQPRAGALGPLLLAAEAGTLTARLDGPAVLTRAAAAGTSGPSPTAVPPGVDLALSPGDGLMISPGVRHAFRNAEHAPAVVLALALLPWGSGSPEAAELRWPAEGSPDVAVQVLTDGVAAVPPAGPVTLALGRVTLASEVGLAPAGAPWPMVAVVEAGTLGLANAGGHAALLTAGQGIVIPTEPVASLRNAGDDPLVLLLLTIAPAATEDASP